MKPWTIQRQGCIATVSATVVSWLKRYQCRSVAVRYQCRPLQPSQRYNSKLEPKIASSKAAFLRHFAIFLSVILYCSSREKKKTTHYNFFFAYSSIRRPTTRRRDETGTRFLELFYFSPNKEMTADRFFLFWTRLKKKKFEKVGLGWCLVSSWLARAGGSFGFGERGRKSERVERKELSVGGLQWQRAPTQTNGERRRSLMNERFAVGNSTNEYTRTNGEDTEWKTERPNKMYIDMYVVASVNGSEIERERVFVSKS